MSCICQVCSRFSGSGPHKLATPSLQAAGTYKRRAHESWWHISVACLRRAFRAQGSFIWRAAALSRSTTQAAAAAPQHSNILVCSGTRDDPFQYSFMCIKTMTSVAAAINSSSRGKLPNTSSICCLCSVLPMWCLFSNLVLYRATKALGTIIQLGLLYVLVGLQRVQYAQTASTD